MSYMGIKAVKRHEAFREYAYPDPASPLARVLRQKGFKFRWGFEPMSSIILRVPLEFRQLSPEPLTCGYGETRGITIDTRWTEAEASARLDVRYAEFERGVLALCTVTANENELAAMTSLAYNIGLGAFRTSTVLRCHNRGDSLSASRAFGLFNKSKGKVVEGLTIRRAEEAAAYLKPVFDAGNQRLSQIPETLPQAVDPESKMSESPINRAGVIAGGTTAVAAVSEVSRLVSDVKYSVASVGDWLIPIALVTVVGLVGYMVYQRFKQRKLGWA